MLYKEAWKELIERMKKDIETLDSAEKSCVDAGSLYETIRLQGKAEGIRVILGRMLDYERSGMITE